MPGDGLGARIGEALFAACHPQGATAASVGGMAVVGLSPLRHFAGAVPVDATIVAGADAAALDVDRLVVTLFRQEGQSLVRLARLLVDDRNAAEDLVQEAFLRLARSAHRIKDESKAAAYLRSIVLNLARDNNRRGLVSLRHHLPFDDRRASTEDEIELREDQRDVIEALRALPHRQRTALVLRYYEELGIDEIADAMGISRNSVKTHLQRGLATLEVRLADSASGRVESGVL
jgi:RNA polymerase sigma-70 factor (sigma-E family)